MLAPATLINRAPLKSSLDIIIRGAAGSVIDNAEILSFERIVHDDDIRKLVIEPIEGFSQALNKRAPYGLNVCDFLQAAHHALISHPKSCNYGTVDILRRARNLRCETDPLDE